MPSRRLPSNSRKLLVASIGVAAVTYVASSCDTNTPVSGNLMAPDDASTYDVPTSGNLMAPDSAYDDIVTSGNLVAPPDAAADADASNDAADAGDAADGHD